MNVTAIIDDTIARFRNGFTFFRNGICSEKRICLRQIIRPDRRFAVTAGDIEHIVRLAQSGHPPPQCTHQFLAMRERRTQVRGAGREVAMVQIIRLDPAFNERAHQRFQCHGIVIDATQRPSRR